MGNSRLVPQPHLYPRLVVTLALTAVLIGRGLAQALPGSIAGIDALIVRVGLAGAIVTQLGAALLAALAMRNATLLLFTHPGQPLLKLLSGASTAVVVLMTLFAALLSHNQVSPEWSMLAAAIVAATLAWSGAACLAKPEQRVVGMLGIGIAVTSLVHTLARIQALVAAERASSLGFAAARWMATLGFVFELVCLAGALTWLMWPRNTVTRSLGASIVALAPAVALGGMRESGLGLVVGRTLQQLSAHPDPVLPRLVRDSVEVAALGAVLLCVFSSARASALLMVVGLALLGRASADIPLGAIFLLNAALALQLLDDESPSEALHDESRGVELPGSGA